MIACCLVLISQVYPVFKLLNIKVVACLSLSSDLSLLISLTAGDEGRTPGLVSMDSVRRKMSGPILNSVSFSMLENPATKKLSL